MTTGDENSLNFLSSIFYIQFNSYELFEVCHLQDGLRYNTASCRNTTVNSIGVGSKKSVVFYQIDFNILRVNGHGFRPK